jgi:Protein of unknown function (DUF732)
MSMQIAPIARPHTEAIATVTTPITVPLNAQTATVEHVAGIALGRGRRGAQTNRVVRRLSTGLSLRQRFVPLAAAIAAAVALASPVHADVDTDFANQLHVYGVYGPKDYNAWLGKIACKRMGNGMDAGAYESAAFLSKNLPQGTTTAQTWQFLNSAINTYCPDQMPVLTSAAGRRQ